MCQRRRAFIRTGKCTTKHITINTSRKQFKAFSIFLTGSHFLRWVRQYSSPFYAARVKGAPSRNATANKDSLSQEFHISVVVFKCWRLSLSGFLLMAVLPWLGKATSAAACAACTAVSSDTAYKRHARLREHLWAPDLCRSRVSKKHTSKVQNFSLLNLKTRVSHRHPPHSCYKPRRLGLKNLWFHTLRAIVWEELLILLQPCWGAAWFPSREPSCHVSLTKRRVSYKTYRLSIKEFLSHKSSKHCNTELDRKAQFFNCLSTLLTPNGI